MWVVMIIDHLVENLGKLTLIKTKRPSMNNVILIRFQTLIMAGMVSIIAVLSPPALSQEKEEESILIESTITGDVNLSEAVTVEDLKIPVT